MVGEQKFNNDHNSGMGRGWMEWVDCVCFVGLGNEMMGFREDFGNS